MGEERERDGKENIKKEEVQMNKNTICMKSFTLDFHVAVKLVNCPSIHFTSI